MVFHCGLITNEVEHLFLCLLFTWVSPSVKCLFVVFTHLSAGLFVFSLLICRPLYVHSRNSSSVVCIENIFCKSTTDLFCFLACLLMSKGS